jgi:hypothetical protein
MAGKIYLIVFLTLLSCKAKQSLVGLKFDAELDLINFAKKDFANRFKMDKPTFLRFSDVIFIFNGTVKEVAFYCKEINDNLQSYSYFYHSKKIQIIKFTIYND